MDRDFLSTVFQANNRPIVYRPKQTLFVQNWPSMGVYYIRRGKIKISDLSTDGKETIFNIKGPGEVLALHSLFTRGRVMHETTATALSETEVYFMEYEGLRDLVHTQKEVCAHLFQMLGDELQEQRERYLQKNNKNVRERLATYLLELKSKEGILDDQGVWTIPVHLSRENLASVIGTACETAIRFFSELKQENIISQRGKTIIINDMDRLAQFAAA